MNQDERNKILFKIEKEKVDNNLLFLADLNTYYDFNSNVTLNDKIYEFQNNIKRMKHNDKISFTNAQFDMYNKIKKKGKYAISATTSFGKTTLIKEYIKELQPNIVLYVVPTNSLADELLMEFHELFGNYNVIDTIAEQNVKLEDKTIFVGTQEKLCDIDINLNDVNLFVIDEAYKLNDEINGYREIALNRILIDYSKKTETLILLLPLVKEIDGLDKFDIKLLKKDYSPVTKSFISIDDENYDNEIVSKIVENKEKNLVYFSTPKICDDFYETKLSNLPDVYEDEWVKRVSKEFHEEWVPLQAYRKGICIHNGNMPKFIQVQMTKKFNNKLLTNDKNVFNTILSTSSLIEGVNTPTKNIFLKDQTILKPKVKIKYKNLIGRAGRLNVTPVGYIYYPRSYQDDIDVANDDLSNNTLKLIICDGKNLEEINRDEETKIINNIAEKYNILSDDLKQYVEESGIKASNIEKLINKLKKYQEKLLNGERFLDKSPGLIYFYRACLLEKSQLYKIKQLLNDDEDILKKVFTSTINSYVGEICTRNFHQMVNYVKNTGNPNIKVNQIVSAIISMVYNFLPYDLIPLIENSIKLNELFKKNENEILGEDTIIKLKKQLNAYNLKYYGSISVTEKEKKIIKRMFEYGISFDTLKEDLNFFSSKLKPYFSILDIKKIIIDDEKLLEKYKYYFDLQ